MKVVLDASAAVEIVFKRGQAQRLMDVLEQADAVLAPELFIPEVVNTIWKCFQFERLDLNACDLAIESALALVDGFVASKETYGEAFLLARSLRRPAYDMFYLALARREDAVFLTSDAALRREAEHQGVRVE